VGSCEGTVELPRAHDVVTCRRSYRDAVGQAAITVFVTILSFQVVGVHGSCRVGIVPERAVRAVGSTCPSGRPQAEPGVPRPGERLKSGTRAEFDPSPCPGVKIRGQGGVEGPIGARDRRRGARLPPSSDSRFSRAEAPGSLGLGVRQHSLAIGRSPGTAGYTTTLAPLFSQRDEEGFSSCSMRLGHRAVAPSPAGAHRRVSQTETARIAFAGLSAARPPGLGSFGANSRSLALRPGDSLTILPMGG
jgi:hypothetical protein